MIRRMGHGLFTIALATFPSVLGGTASAADAGAAPPAIPACISVKTDAIWVPYGYNHLVTVTNGCRQTAACVVSTDVSPEPQSTTIAAGAKAEVTTFMGSPSSVFTAKVSCKLR